MGSTLMPPEYLGRRTKTKVKCPRCGQNEMARVARQGFWQGRILPLLGRYPWQCAICGAARVLKRRGATIRRTDQSRDELETGETAAEHAHQF